MPPAHPEKARVAGVLLYREGKALLQHRDENPAIPWPGAWCIFGGKVEEGETPEEAARREIEEELGLRLEGPLSLIYHSNGERLERFFYAAPLLVSPEDLTLNEGQGMALLSPAEWEHYGIIPLHTEILTAFFKQLEAQGENKP